MTKEQKAEVLRLMSSMPFLGGHFPQCPAMTLLQGFWQISGSYDRPLSATAKVTMIL